MVYMNDGSSNYTIVSISAGKMYTEDREDIADTFDTKHGIRSTTDFMRISPLGVNASGVGFNPLSPEIPEKKLPDLQM